MNSTRTTNILLSVLLLVSIGNVLKTDSLGRDFVIQLEQMRIQQNIPLTDIKLEVEAIDQKLDTIEYYSRTAAYK